MESWAFLGLVGRALAPKVGCSCGLPAQGTSPHGMGGLGDVAISCLPGSGPGMATGLMLCACCTRGRCCTTASTRTKRGSSPYLTERSSTHSGRYTSPGRTGTSSPVSLPETRPLRACRPPAVPHSAALGIMMLGGQVPEGSVTCPRPLTLSPRRHACRRLHLEFNRGSDPALGTRKHFYIPPGTQGRFSDKCTQSKGTDVWERGPDGGWLGCS